MNKNHRIIAYRIVDEILSRDVPAVVLNHQIEPDSMTLQEKAEVIERSKHILSNLREDARDLWDES